jgi:hypothetical protein
MLGAYYGAVEVEFLGASPFEANVYGNSKEDGRKHLVSFRLRLHVEGETKST